MSALSELQLQKTNSEWTNVNFALAFTVKTLHWHLLFKAPEESLPLSVQHKWWATGGEFEEGPYGNVHWKFDSSISVYFWNSSVGLQSKGPAVSRVMEQKQRGEVKHSFYFWVLIPDSEKLQIPALNLAVACGPGQTQLCHYGCSLLLLKKTIF